MTLEDVRKKIEAQQAKEAERQNRILQLKQSLDSTKAEEQEALNAGDFEAFTSAKAKSGSLLLQIDFLERASLQKITEPELAEAWESIATANAKKMAKAKAQFEKVKSQFKQSYAEMLAIQAEAIQAREELGSYIGLHYDGIGDANNTFTMFPLKEQIDEAHSNLRLGQGAWNDPDGCYFLAGKSVNEINDLYRLVHNHTL